MSDATVNSEGKRNVVSFPFIERRSGQDRRAGQLDRAHSDRRSGYDRRRPQLPEPSSNDYALGRGAGLDGGLRASVQQGMPFPAGLRDFLSGVGTMMTQLVAGFYDASMDPKLWPSVLGRMQDAVRADVAAVVSHDFDTGRGQLDHSVSIDAMFVTAYGEFYSRQNSWLQHPEHFRHPGAVWSSHQLAEDAKVVESDFYRYWLRPQNLLHHLFGVLDVQGNRVTLLTVGRARDQGAFWEDDVELLRRLLPHLRQGLRAGHAFRRVQEVERILRDTLDVMPIGVALLAGSGVVVAANRVAREIIDTEDALYHGSGGLGLKLAAGRFRFRDFLAGSLTDTTTVPDGASDVHTFSVPRGPERRPITLLVMPARDWTPRRGDNDPVAVLFIGDPERTVDIDPRRLVRLHGLSRAEARVAVLLAKGNRLEQVAEQLGLTYETVRKHLKQIFAKTGTDRQAELVRTLVSGPAGLRF